MSKISTIHKLYIAPIVVAIITGLITKKVINEIGDFTWLWISIAALIIAFGVVYWKAKERESEKEREKPPELSDKEKVIKIAGGLIEAGFEIGGLFGDKKNKENKNINNQTPNT